MGRRKLSASQRCQRETGCRCYHTVKEPVKAWGSARSKAGQAGFWNQIQKQSKESATSPVGSSSCISILELKWPGLAESVGIYLTSSPLLCLATRSLILFRWGCTQPPGIHQDLSKLPSFTG